MRWQHNPAGGHARPDPNLTPGEWTDVHQTRNVPYAIKVAVYKSYRVGLLRRALYTIDHLCPLELNGTNSQRNLWPQPRREAKLKDVDENAAAAAVKNGTMTLDAARGALLAKWR